MRLHSGISLLLAAGLSLPVAGVGIRLSTEEEYGKYQIGEAPQLTVNVALSDLPREALQAKWKLLDIDGATVEDGSFVAAETTQSIPLSLPGDGYYQFQVALSSADGIPHGEAATGIVRTAFQTANSFDRQGRWAVNGHSRTEEYPILRKLGVTMSRLDISWRDLEPQPGVWNFEKSDRIAAASRRDGVLVLAILGKNPPWLALPEGQGTDREKFLDYVRRTVTRYCNDIFFWDLWNEPQYSWNGSKTEFGLVMRDAYHIIKEIQPESTVVFNGHPFEEELRSYTLENLAPLNGEIPFDALGMHPYSRPRSPDDNRFLEHMSNIHALLERIAPGKDLWISELGWPTSTDALGVSELKQAAYLQRAALLGIAAGVKKFVWYMPYSGGDPTYHENEYGLFRFDLTPKPALAAYAFLIRMLDKMEFVREIPLGEAVCCLEFAGRDGKKFQVLWATGDAVKLSTAWPEGIRIRRGDGSLLPVEPELEVGALPIFLDQVDASASLEKAHLSLARPLRLESATLTPEGVLLLLRNRAGRELPVEASLELPSGVTFRNPAIADGFKFQMRNAPKELLLKLNYPGGAFRGTAKLTLRTADAVQTEEIPLRVEQAAFGKYGSELQLNSVSDIGPADMQKEWRSPDDLSCRAQFGWNEQGLLFQAEVRDDDHHNPFEASNIWAGDSLQLAFRPVPGNVPDYYDEHCVEIGVALTDGDKLQKVVYSGNGGRDFEAAVTRSEEEKITRYDVLIPWKLAGLKHAPAPGSMISWNFAVNDIDRGSGGRKWVEMAPGICIGKNPAQFPRFILMKEEK